MKAKRRHKRILSVLILVLYGFIITPVSLWHSHSCDGRSIVSKQISGCDEQAGDVDNSCDICNHVYSGHLSHEDVQLTACSVEFRLYREIFIRSIPNIFTGHPDSRGSPFIVAPSLSFS